MLPAIHLKKEEVGKTFHEKLNTEKGNNDPHYLTAAARQHLRQKFLEADMAVTGVNFAVAETGTAVVCTNEGNADMGIHAAPVQVHCIGIEKIIPKTTDLPFASSLCGSCSDVCPVKIDIHSQLYRWRQEIAEKKELSASKSAIMTITGQLLASGSIYNATGKIARWSLRNLPRPFIYNSLNVWGKGRELPTSPQQSFKEWYKINRKGE